MKYLLIAILVFGLSGCASPELIRFDDQNAANSVKAANQILKHWRMNSAFIRTASDGQLDESQNYAIKKPMDKLDELAKKSLPLTDEKDVGETLGWFGLFLSAGGQKVVDTVMPYILRLIAAAGG